MSEACSSFTSISGLRTIAAWVRRVACVVAAASLVACGSSSGGGGNDDVDRTPPSVPSGLVASSTGTTTIDLTWNASTDAGGSGLKDYVVYRDGTSIATVTGTSMTNSALAPSTTFTYQVAARDNANNESSRSAGVQANTQAAPASGSGLDVRPSNATCLAPSRGVQSSAVAIDRVFPALTFASPVGAVQVPNDGSRWFVVERAGRVMTFDVDDPSSASAFLDLRDVVTTAGEEEAGLLGLAFHPAFATNGRLYVFYTGPPDSGYRIQSRISEFTSADRITVNRATERILIKANKAESNHNGGQLAFGPDGYLYASLGDGGAANDPHGNAQSVLTLFGKIIRIDVDGESPYGIPVENPYEGNALCASVASGFGTGDTSRAAAACPEIYAYGLRNPWRFSLDRGAGAADLWVGDVGQGAYEEINRIQGAGGNYGWDTKEGPACHEPSSSCSSTGLIDPIAAAPRSTGLASIIGGFVYRGNAIPALVGRYLFTDFYTRGLYAYDAAAPNGYTRLLDTGVMASSFAQDNSGELYLVAYDSGGLFAIKQGSGSGNAPVPDDLSETGCVIPTSPSQPAAGLIPYSPNAPFWSDGADKERWLALPDGLPISPEPDGDWALPPRSVLMKHFRLDGQLIETRLMMRHPDGEWAGYTYQWNSAQTQAIRVHGGATVIHGAQSWTYPSEAQCMQCHTAAAGHSLGLENTQQNGETAYPQTGRSANQIVTLKHIGVLPASLPNPVALAALPSPYDATAGTLTQRARAYLHTNCAQCHRPGGGGLAALDLRYSLDIGAANVCDTEPTHGDLGISDAKRIAPGDPSRSVLYLRMSRRGTGQMPPVGSNLVDDQGAALIEDWIRQMDASCN